MISGGVWSISGGVNVYILPMRVADPLMLLMRYAADELMLLMLLLMLLMMLMVQFSLLSTLGLMSENVRFCS